jgi:hypothetical protein
MAQKLLTKSIIEAIAKTPYGSEDGVDRDNKKVIARFFGGAAFVCYVLEDDSFFKEYKTDEKTGKTVPTSIEESNIEENMIVFCAQSIGHGLELGGVSLKEVFELRFRPFGLGVERDSSVEPFKYTLGELRKRQGEEWM